MDQKQDTKASAAMTIIQPKETPSDFDIDALVWAIQNDLSASCVERYLKRWNAPRIKQELSKPVKMLFNNYLYPALFFAVERNCPELIRLLCSAGADPAQQALPTRMPVLAYCIMSAEYQLSDTTDVLFTLLAMGANPYDLPQDMWCHYIKNPAKVGPQLPVAEMEKYSWCSHEIRAALCRTFNLLQRYQFKMASLLPGRTAQAKQVAAAFDITPLFEIPFQIIGQRLAARTVQEWVMSHALHHIEMPLVLLFTGPSGHGKTELAKRMGELLSLPLLKIDCTQIHVTTDLFGPQAPFAGHEAGSPLNNFLADHSGQKAVVFLDEFEKTTPSIHKSLLLLFDEGFYKDRRTVGKQLDGTKIIWILASNQGEEMIQKYWDVHLANQPEHAQLQLPIEPLQRTLEQSFQSTLGAPLTGRLSAIIPFLPFTPEERAVTTYKFMRKLFNSTRRPISVPAAHLARHLYLNFIDDGALASFIAERYYSPELGARSLLKAVNTQVCHKLTKAFLAKEDEITDGMNEGGWECYDVAVKDLKGGFREIVVKANGVRNLQARNDDDFKFGLTKKKSCEDERLVDELALRLRTTMRIFGASPPSRAEKKKKNKQVPGRSRK
ncbi:MAG: hypothetical protein LQ339_005016 [Xanthoria mediterranea]|nr:MAG: hypothetical protein LQ339_005016 [Xanthoria mediterranea]